LREAGESAGLAEVARLNRNLKDTSKAFNPLIGKIKTERIVIFHKKGVSYL
jgi:site-specific DNA-methyltransferase (cytosine-N4-specific)